MNGFNFCFIEGTEFCAHLCQTLVFALCVLLEHTVNGERFAGPNFHIFHGFLEYRESFSMNINASLYLY